MSDDGTTTRAPVVLSWSGGKDCARALEALRAGRFPCCDLLPGTAPGEEPRPVTV